MNKKFEKCLANDFFLLYNYCMGRKKKNDVAFAVAEPPKEEVKEIKIDENVKKDFLEVLFYQIKQRDGLLGEFSLDGKYKISNEKILQALVTVPKLFQEKDEKVLRAISKIGKVTLNFRVDLDINPSYCSAHLSLIEIEHKYDEDVKHVTELADIVEIYSPLFVANVMKAWNIKKEASELDKDDFLEGYLKKQEADEAFLKELSDILAQVYLVRMLKLLENCGEKGLLIKEEYSRLLAMLLSKDPGMMQDNIKLKHLLDGIILKHNAFDEILRAGGESILRGYSFPIDNVRGKDSTAAPVVETTKKAAEPEKKKEDSGKAKTKESKSKPVTPYKIPGYKSPKEKAWGVLDPLPARPILKTEENNGKGKGVEKTETKEQQENGLSKEELAKISAKTKENEKNRTIIEMGNVQEKENVLNTSEPTVNKAQLPIEETPNENKASSNFKMPTFEL